jgi:hypothetical protein
MTPTTENPCLRKGVDVRACRQKRDIARFSLEYAAVSARTAPLRRGQYQHFMDAGMGARNRKCHPAGRHRSLKQLFEHVPDQSRREI